MKNEAKLMVNVALRVTCKGDYKVRNQILTNKIKIHVANQLSYEDSSPYELRTEY